MNKETFHILRQDAHRAFCERRLGDSLAALKGMAECLGDGEMKESLQSLETDYSMMTDYMARGFRDERRKELYSRFLQRAVRIWAGVCRAFEVKEGLTLYATTWKTLEITRQNNTRTGALSDPKCTGRTLFDAVWTSPLWSESERENADTFLYEEGRSEEDKALLLSGVMMASFHCFDPMKICWLIDSAAHPSPILKARALTGAALVSLYHRQLLSLFSEVSEHWNRLKSVPQMDETLYSLQAQLLMSLETNHIDHKVREEILPEVMEQSRMMGKNRKNLNWDELQEELAKLGTNPEWEKREHILNDKMKQLAEMQQKGVDVFHGSFKMFKQNFPFFSVAANWFVPFTFNHPDLPENLRRNKMTGTIVNMAHLCDSDKYSLCLMLGTMPESFSQAGGMGTPEALQKMFEEQGLSSMEVPRKDTKECIRSYVPDLYRFFTLFNRRDMSINPFSGNLLFTEIPEIATLFVTPARMKELGDFAFELNAYSRAEMFYSQLEDSAETFQKIGYCRQIMRNYRGALEAYEKADFISGGSIWTLKHLATCHRFTGNYAKALKAYEDIERLCPEDADVSLRLGECHIQMGYYEEARKKLFKAYYLNPDDHSVWRALAWCALVTGNYPEAESYYDKLIGREPLAEDWQNAGHTAWMEGNVAMAVERYLQCMKADSNMDKPSLLFKQDAGLLSKCGIEEDDIHIMCDIISQKRYS